MHLLHSLTTTYLTEIRNQRAQVNSTDELSYRDFLGKFLRGAAEALGKTASFTGEAKKITFGRPDYEVTHGLKVVGYVEAEALGTPLGQLKGSAKEQNERFRSNLHNFLLTNHTEFRLFLGGKEVGAALLPEPPEHGAVKVSDAALDTLQTLLETFLDATTPAATTPEAIARQLARRARFLRVAADAMLSHDDSPLHSLWNLYKVTLFDGLSAEKFADVYAQTFTYGLFLAWLNTDKKPFDRPTALRAIPRAVPPIRVLLQFGGGDDLPEEFHWIVNGICSDLEAADKGAATKHPAGIADPLIYFYETFLSAYDPALRERAGVYYTPDPVVDFLVRAVDDLLRRDFGKSEGLADESVRLLDPATGTATFLARAYRQVHQTMTEGGNGGVWPDRARDHLAKHFYGFERLPAAYTLAHVKLRQQLAELSVTLGDNERLPVYLADTMMNRVPDQMHLPGADVLSKEIRDASHVRDQEHILVVLGNPPYFGNSDNPSKDSAGKPTFIGGLIQTYFQVDGVPLGERNPKWLQNDYVKFIRFAQWRIERSGSGIVAFITDNSYLDNPTFRGMRRSLMKTFDEISILDLHGNSKKKERSPDGSKDQNVFDITQGVAICLMIKHSGAVSKAVSVVRFAELYGTRSQKYARLLSSNTARISDTDWLNLNPNPPFYALRPENQDVRAEYEQGWRITEAFYVNVMGFQTHRDHFAIDIDRVKLQKRMSDFRDKKFTDKEIEERFNVVDNRDWKIADARTKLRMDTNWEKTLTECLYRPFDTRSCYYSEIAMDYPRREIIRNVLDRSDLCLGVGRQGLAVNEAEWTLVSISRLPVDANVFRRGGINLFPLYIYPTEKEAVLGIEREANIAPAFISEVKERIGDTPRPENIFYYAYAVFHAPTYRTRYAAFLKTDFPRLPLPPDAQTFHALATLGAKLTALHLLEDPTLQQHGIGFPVPGSHTVKKMRTVERYIPPTPGGKPGRVKLNDDEYFDNVPPEAWEFRVGGYQPAAKWLEDRAGRVLTSDDITHYRRMIAAMRETAALLPQVDAAFLTLLAKNAEPATEGQGEEGE